MNKTILSFVFCAGLLSAQTSLPDPAAARLKDVYDRLAKLGVMTGPGTSAHTPLVVNGRPATAIIIADWHQENYGARALQAISAVAREFRISTLVLEGNSADPQAHQRATASVQSFNRESTKETLNEQIRSALGDGGGSTDYNPIDYHTSIVPGGFPSRYEGMESRHAEDLYYLQLSIYYSLGVEMLGGELQKDHGRFVLSVDGHPYNQGRAVFIAAERELAFRYGPEFPRFFVALDKPNDSVEIHGARVPAIVLTAEKHRAEFQEYLKRFHRFWVTRNIRERNFGFAQRIVELFLNQEKRESSQQEDIALVIVGAAHLISNPQNPASPPSLVALLSNVGISVGTVYALEEGDKLVNNIDPDTGAPDAIIVKHPGKPQP